MPFEGLAVHLMLMVDQADGRTEFLVTGVTFEVSGLLVHNQDSFIYKFALAIPVQMVSQVNKEQNLDRAVLTARFELWRRLRTSKRVVRPSFFFYASAPPFFWVLRREHKGSEEATG